MRETRIGLFVVTLLLISTGILMVYSASSIYAHEKWHDSFYYLKRDIIYGVIGAILAGLVMSMDYYKLKTYSKILVFISTILLILVLIPGIGKEVGGARRWFKFWIMSFQPSEFAKLSLIIYMADVLSRKQPKIKSFFHGFLPPMFILGISLGLVLMQPDLGTAVAMGVIAFIMFLVAGIRLVHLVPAILSSIPVLYALVFNVTYRRRRILAFMNPWNDPQGVGFQIIQSFLALGSGGLLGVGLGQSRQKLFYLPESHTDFIFSIIGEELGLAGTLSVILLFFIFIIYGTKIAVKATEIFGHLLAVGLVSMIAIEAIINIAVVTGSVPTKGLPMPFISYGGSALICNMVAVGLLLNIGKHRFRL